MEIPRRAFLKLGFAAPAISFPLSGASVESTHLAVLNKRIRARWPNFTGFTAKSNGLDIIGFVWSGGKVCAGTCCSVTIYGIDGALSIDGIDGVERTASQKISTALGVKAA